MAAPPPDPGERAMVAAMVRGDAKAWEAVVDTVNSRIYFSTNEGRVYRFALE